MTNSMRTFPARPAVVLIHLVVSSIAGAADPWPAVTECGARQGVAVVVGQPTASWLADLTRDRPLCVQVLVRDPARAAALRRELQAAGLHGRITVDEAPAGRLPYIDNFVNLLIVADDPKLPAAEYERVLCPGGRLLPAGGVALKPVTKPWPADIDSWGHIMHAPDGNPVSRDRRAGFPAYGQWNAGPDWPRHHDADGGTTCLLTDAGRIFSLRDEAPAYSSFIPSDGWLVAQDAWNGVELWRKPIAPWRFGGNRETFATLTRRLVVVGDLLYVVMGLDAPVSVLDAATGAPIRTLPGSDHAGEIIVTPQAIYVSCGLATEETNLKANAFWVPAERMLKAYAPGDGRLLWEVRTGMFPLSLAVGDGGVFYHDTDRVVCLDPATGKRRWGGDDTPFKSVIRHSVAPILAVKNGLVLYSMSSEFSNISDRSMGKGLLHAYDAATGAKRWVIDRPYVHGVTSPQDIFVIGDRLFLYSREHGSAGDSGMRLLVLDLATGGQKFKEEHRPDISPHFFHARCHRNRATECYVITGNHGFELINVETKKWQAQFWLRGGCNFGLIPANGMLYTPPGPCVCFSDTMLRGTWAVAPRAAWMDDLAVASDEGRLVTGPALERFSGSPAMAAGWPTFRANAARTGHVDQPIAAALAPRWELALGGRLSAPVAADGKVFVSQIDACLLHAIDAATGKSVWNFPAGGRINSPPTIIQAGAKALCVFGANDGSIYALDAADGALAWRFRAAPLAYRMGGHDRIESLWPVHGSVLFDHGRISAVAGRSIHLAGGMRLVQLDPLTGRKLNETILDAKDPKTGKQVDYDTRQEPGMPVGMPDILSGDETNLYMRSQSFDLDGRPRFFRNQVRDNDGRLGKGLLEKIMAQPERHIFSSVGFLDDSWFHRSYMLYANLATYASGGHWVAGQSYPSGKLLVRDGQHVYSYSTKPETRRWITKTTDEFQVIQTDLKPRLETVSLVNDDGQARRSAAKPEKAAAKDGKRADRTPKTEQATFVSNWGSTVPILARAMAKVGDRLFVAGPPDIGDNEPAKQYESWQGKLGGSLMALSPRDGKIESTLELASPPVWNGIAVAEGRVILVTLDGKVMGLAP